jgi:hypothetical protein
MEICRRIADIVWSAYPSRWSPERPLKGIHLRNIFLIEKGSLLTAVASYASISII